MNSYGKDYEIKVGKVRAKKLLSGSSRDLPRMGYSMVIAQADVVIEGNIWTSYLSLDNLSGSYYVRCCNETKDRWAKLFGIDAPELAS